MSFARKIRLIPPVIYGMINLWNSVFVLPKQFYEKVDLLCSSFLWNNKKTSTEGARVVSNDVCKSKEKGRLGIRLLVDFEIMFRLKKSKTFSPIHDLCGWLG